MDSTPKRIHRPIAFFTVYCMNFIIFWCVTLKLFSFNFVPLLARNPGDASVCFTSRLTSDQCRMNLGVSCDYYVTEMKASLIPHSLLSVSHFCCCCCGCSALRDEDSDEINPLCENALFCNVTMQLTAEHSRAQ